MQILIGDIGNTLTKLCLVNETSVITKEYNFETTKIIKEKNLAKIFETILNKNIKKKILFSSVVPKAYQKLKDTRANYCFSVTSFEFPIQRAIKISNKGCVEMFYPKFFNTRSQDLEEAYHDAGQFYWGKARAFEDELPLFSEGSIPYILESFLVQDIDTEENWKRAEIMYQVLKIKNLI